MGRLALGMVGLVGVAVGVPATAVAELAVGPDVPFTAGELEAALVPRGIAVPDGTVALVAATTVELTTPAGRQHVELGPARGVAAARLVALHLAEPGDAVDLPAAELVAAAPPVAVAPTWRLSLVTGVGRGAAAIDFGLLAVRADATRAHGRWRYGASLGWLHGLAQAADPTRPVGADLGIARIAAGVALGRVEVVAGPALVVHRVSGSGSSGASWGAGGSVRARLLGVDRWSVIATGDVDVLGHRVVVARDGAEFAATPRVAFTGALGVRWEGP
jgi:hypothetical protein